MSEKECVFQTEYKINLPPHKKLMCGLTGAGTMGVCCSDCKPEICPIYQLWKRETK